MRYDRTPHYLGPMKKLNRTEYIAGRLREWLYSLARWGQKAKVCNVLIFYSEKRLAQKFGVVRRQETFIAGGRLFLTHTFKKFNGSPLKLSQIR